MNNELEIILESILEKVKKESASLNTNQKKILIYKSLYESLTNRQDLLEDKDETLKLTNGEGKYTIFPFTASQLLGPFTDFDYLIKLLGNEELTSNLNEEEFKEQFRKIHSMFLENKQFVNDIYTDIHKNIENINQEVREKTYKYLYCQK